MSSTTAPAKNQRRVRALRSIAFTPAAKKYLVKQAKQLNRSVNWVVNEIVRLQMGEDRG